MKVELLAPAGDLERLKIAFTYGADAVYLGGNLFGLRANAVNFSLEEIKEGVIYAHNLNKKVYVTVNIVLHDKELDLLDDYLKSLSEIGVDAIIISDLGIIPVAKKYNLDVHISTQQSTLNKEAIKFYQKLGVTRVVLAREASKEEIEDNIKTGMEIEIFIHGAMCASYSGRCVLSNYLTNRDANRGGCSQICRWDFDLIGDGKLVKGEKNFTFCSKDLMLLKHINEIIDMNVTSLKIEGRMRSIYYIATVISIYRKVIETTYKDFKLNNEYYKSLFKNIFFKTAKKTNTHCTLKSFGFIDICGEKIFFTKPTLWDVSSDDNIFLSETFESIIDIENDMDCKEYRAFVINNNLLSISRSYIDYPTEIPNEVKTFIKEQIEKTSSINEFPNSYVLDVGQMIIDNKEVIDIIEYNQITSSGLEVCNLLVDNLINYNKSKRKEKILIKKN